MKIKEQTRKLAAGCSKHRFEVVDKTDEVSNHIYGKATLTWFEFDFRRVLTVVNFLWIKVVLEEALFCQAIILSSRLTVVVVGVN